MIANFVISHDIFCFPTNGIKNSDAIALCNRAPISTRQGTTTAKPQSSILSHLPIETVLHVLNLVHPRSLAICASSTRQVAAILTHDPSNTAHLFLAQLPTILSFYGHSRSGNRTSSTTSPMSDYLASHSTSPILASPLVTDKLMRLAIRYHGKSITSVASFPIFQLIHGHCTKSLLDQFPIHQLVRGPVDSSLASAVWPSRLVDLLISLITTSQSTPKTVCRIVSTLARHWPELLAAPMDHWRTHPLLELLHLTQPPTPISSAKMASRPIPSSSPCPLPHTPSVAHLLALLAARQGHLDLLDTLAPLVSEDRLPIAVYLLSDPWLAKWWCSTMHTQDTIPVVAWAYNQVDPDSIIDPFFLTCMDKGDENVVSSVFLSFDYPRLKSASTGCHLMWAPVMAYLTDPCAPHPLPARVAKAIGRLLGQSMDRGQDLLLAIATSAKLGCSAQSTQAWQRWTRARMEMVCRGFRNREERLKLFTHVYLHLLDDYEIPASSSSLAPLVMLMTHLAPTASIHPADVLIATYPLADHGAVRGYFPYLRAFGLDSHDTATYLLGELAAWWAVQAEEQEVEASVVFAMGLLADVEGDVDEIVEWLHGQVGGHVERMLARVWEELVQQNNERGRGWGGKVRLVPLAGLSRVRIILDRLRDISEEE